MVRFHAILRRFWNSGVESQFPLEQAPEEELGRAQNEQGMLGEHERGLLLKAYELERLDDIQSASTMLALLAPTLGLLSLIGFALVNADSLPAWLLALVPLPPLPFMAYGALYAHLAQVRGALIDRYERELRNNFDVTAGGLRVPSGHQVLGRIWTTTFGRLVVAISALSLFAVYVAVLVVSFRDARKAEPALAYFGLVFASCATGLIIALYIVALWPERALRRHAADLVR